jgi:hypothetical protein
MLREAGMENVLNVEGGTSACIDAGLPVIRGKKVISLERQVRIAAGISRHDHLFESGTFGRRDICLVDAGVLRPSLVSTAKCSEGDRLREPTGAPTQLPAWPKRHHSASAKIEPRTKRQS